MSKSKIHIRGPKSKHVQLNPLSYICLAFSSRLDVWLRNCPELTVEDCLREC
jgi:hypothetical protein